MTKLLRIALLITAACGGLAACSPEKPWMMEKSTLVENPIRLVESRHITKMPLSQMGESDTKEAARVFRKNGAGPMYVVVAYKDHGKLKDSQAVAKMAEITNGLLAQGVAQSDIIASTVPLETDTPVALIAFDTLEAMGPEGCEQTPGYDIHAEEDNLFDYKTGCGVKTAMAKQIANPKDLEGVAGLGGGADGQHAAEVIGGQYRPGAEPREFLPSYVISELANSGS